MNKADKLVAMGNQIAGFFATQSGDQAGAVAAHLAKFWTPTMCVALASHIEDSGDGAPLLKEAVKKLHSHR